MLLADIITRYVEHVRAIKTPKSAQTDVYYLRQMFGPLCPAPEITSRKWTPKSMKRPSETRPPRRHVTGSIEATYLDQITTKDIAEFIKNQVKSRDLAPKTANRYRKIVCCMINWAMRGSYQHVKAWLSMACYISAAILSERSSSSNRKPCIFTAGLIWYQR